MQIYFAGIESPAHLKVLRSCGVERVAVSVHNLSRHVNSFDGWATKDRLAGLDWLCYADSPTAPPGPALELLSTADVQAEFACGPVSWIQGTWLENSDIGFLPIWDGRDQSVLRTYTEDYEGVMLPDSVCDNQTVVRTAKMGMPPMGQLAALTGRSKGINQFDLVVSSAWIAVQKHGETQVWAGNRLVRLNSEDKHHKRARYADSIEALGVDVSAVLADDPTETVRCAIRSWIEYEKHLNLVGGSSSQVATQAPLVANGTMTTTNTAVSPPVVVASQVAQTRHLPVASGPLQTLPIMGTTTIEKVTKDAEGKESTESHDTIEANAASARKCLTCRLAAACPGYNPGADCSYGIPVVIRTKDQRQAVMRALMEIQTQRIMFQSFSEQVLGETDPLVGREIDRLFKMIETAKAIEENVPKFRLEMSGSGDQAAASGVISRLFGSEAGTNARALERPMLADEVIEDAEMVDEEPQESPSN